MIMLSGGNFYYYLLFLLLQFCLENQKSSQWQWRYINILAHWQSKLLYKVDSYWPTDRRIYERLPHNSVGISCIKTLFSEGSASLAIQDIWMLAIPLFLLEYLIASNKNVELFYLGLY